MDIKDTDIKRIAVIYNRVSGINQKEALSIEEQQRKNKESYQNRSSEFYKEYNDEAWTGETLRRPALVALLEDAEKGLFNEMYLTDLSRLSRDLNNQLIVIKKLRQYNINICVADKLLEDTPQGNFMINVIGSANQFQKARIVEDTSAGRWRNAKKGKMIQPTAPFGYEFLRDERGAYRRDEKGGKIIAIDEKESEILKSIFERYLQIQNCYALAKELRDAGTKTRKGVLFSQPYLRAILVNDVYTGNWYYGKREAIEPKKRRNGDFIRNLKSSARLRDRKDWIHFEVPQIISQEDFDEVQKVFIKRKRIKGKLTQTYMLNGLLFCANCGWKIYGRKNQSGKKFFYYYTCSRRTRPFQTNSPQCNHPSPRVEVLDQVVWEKLMDCFKNPENIFNSWNSLNNERNDVSIIQSKREDLIKKKEFIKESQMKCLELYEVDEMSKEILIDRMKHHKERGLEIEDELKKIETIFSQIARKESLIRRAKELAKILCKDFSFTLEEKRNFIMGFVDEVRYDPITRDVEIVGDLPILQNVEQLDNLIISSVELLKYLICNNNKEKIRFKVTASANLCLLF